MRRPTIQTNIVIQAIFFIGVSLFPNAFRFPFVHFPSILNLSNAPFNFIQLHILLGKQEVNLKSTFEVIIAQLGLGQGLVLVLVIL